jgi:hypothetical protein
MLSPACVYCTTDLGASTCSTTDSTCLINQCLSDLNCHACGIDCSTAGFLKQQFCYSDPTGTTIGFLRLNGDEISDYKAFCTTTHAWMFDHAASNNATTSIEIPDATFVGGWTTGNGPQQITTNIWLTDVGGTFNASAQLTTQPDTTVTCPAGVYPRILNPTDCQQLFLSLDSCKCYLVSTLILVL